MRDMSARVRSETRVRHHQVRRPTTNSEVPLAPTRTRPRPENAQRFNDGACDARGRFFAGTLETLDPPYAGQLWCFDPLVGEGKARLVDGDIHVSQRVLCLESDGKKAEGADGVCKGKQWHGMES